MLTRQIPVFGLTGWCLLSLWMFFGCLKLAEQFQTAPEIAAEEQERHDLDEETLSQLASGLKSGSSNIGAPGYTSVTSAVADAAFSISVDRIPQVGWLMLHNLPSRPLYHSRSVLTDLIDLASSQ